MGQSRADREWPRPRRVRHVWVLPEKRYEGVMQGLVVTWARRSYRWQALVMMVDDRRTDQPQITVQAGIPLERLRPVRSDENVLARDGWAVERLSTSLSRSSADGAQPDQGDADQLGLVQGRGGWLMVRPPSTNVPGSPVEPQARTQQAG